MPKKYFRSPFFGLATFWVLEIIFAFFSFSGFLLRDIFIRYPGYMKRKEEKPGIVTNEGAKHSAAAAAGSHGNLLFSLFKKKAGNV